VAGEAKPGAKRTKSGGKTPKTPKAPKGAATEVEVTGAVTDIAANATNGSGAVDHLVKILARKEKEVARRKRHLIRARDEDGADRRSRAIAALRRWPGGPPRIIAEFKRRTPSSGDLRPHKVGDVAEIVRNYEKMGAAAISVLADRVNFGGGVLDVRRATRAMSRPVLFKEFVLDPVQVDAARAAGASLVLLLVRALPELRLDSMIDAVRARGMEPVLEVGNASEMERAIATNAIIIGFNARDLNSLEVNPEAAIAAIEELPDDRVAVYMSGIENKEQLAQIALGRTDAVLIGSELMRAPDPGARLGELLGTRPS
jgi:indole-3-glycerol phosphate synthase